MEEIIGTIREAEETAVQIKAEAGEKSAQILADAERTAAEIATKSESDCRTLRERTLKAAQKQAQEEYDAAIAAEVLRAKTYADQKIAATKTFADAAVGRICRDR